MTQHACKKKMRVSAQTSLDSMLSYSGFDCAAGCCATHGSDKDVSVTSPYETQMT